MSASAVKPSIPGVGTSPTSTSHSILPMNAMAQKVMPGTDSSTMKPMTGSNLSYVTLQPPSQPLSLVQDHRPQVFQANQYATNNAEKEPEAEKIIPNGMELGKTESEQETNNSVKQSNVSTNNNTSPSDSVEESQQNVQPEQELTSIALEFPALCTQAQNKTEEKKTPVNNGSKESEGISVSASLQAKLSSHKPEDTQLKAEVQRPKASPQPVKSVGENSVPQITNSPPKTEAKVVSPTKATKRKSRELKDLKGNSTATDEASKPKRNRIQTQPYQSPLPEIALLVKSLNKTPTAKPADDKLIVFYKNEFLAVRNAEGSFFVCQAMQNIYKSSRRIRIRWLSQDKNNGEIYSPDFYDCIDFDCILTNLNLNKIDKNKFQLTKIELLRTENILKRAIDVEAGVSEKPRVTEEHPDGLDLSLYKDESQLKRRKGYSTHKQKQGQRRKSKHIGSTFGEQSTDEETSKKSPKTSRAKKGSINKALAIAKSVAKGSSRAERALNRSSKLDNSSNNNNIATSSVATAAVTTTAATSVDNTKITSEAKKGEPRKGMKQQSNGSTTGVPRTKLRGSAQNTQQSGSATGRPKRVPPGSAVAATAVAAVAASTGTSGTTPTATTATAATATTSATTPTTATNTATTTTGILSSEETTTRKKPRGRA